MEALEFLALKSTGWHLAGLSCKMACTTHRVSEKLAKELKTVYLDVFGDGSEDENPVHQVKLNDYKFIKLQYE